MTTLTLWTPWRSSPAPQAEILTLKKRSSQATLSQDLKAPLHEPEPEANVLDMDIVEISSPQAWEEALLEITQAGICGLDLETTGLDPLSSRARLAQLSLHGRVRSPR